jgi:release factor glutamine methyltransferase
VPEARILATEGVPRIADEVAWGTAELHRAGVSEARREVLRIFGDLTGTLPAAVLARREAPAPPEAASRFRDAIRRRAGGEPLQYVTGLAGFRRLTVACDRRALIPRPETEGLVDLALQLMPRGRALDLGTGTGCIALALADEGGYDQVTAVDRSPETLALARENGARLGLEVRWLLGDWCTPVAGERFDLVVSNPPYIATPELAGLDAGVREFEPALALDGGDDGLREVRRLLATVSEVLVPGGWLVMELDSARAARSAELALRAGWTTVRVLNDLFGRPRYLAARREPDHV